MIREFEKLIQKQIRKNSKTSSFKKVIKNNKKTLNTKKLSTLSF